MDVKRSEENRRNDGTTRRAELSRSPRDRDAPENARQAVPHDDPPTRRANVTHHHMHPGSDSFHAGTTAHAMIGEQMTALTGTRRTPIQQRSRRTVQRILNAAEQIIGEAGVEAVTTRLIAERAGVAAPSLYRFFADRDEILDALLEQMATHFDEHVRTIEVTWDPDSIVDLIRLELGLYVSFYRTHPAAVALWFGGRASPPVIKSIREASHARAARIRTLLLNHELISQTTPAAVFDLAVELGDRVLELAFRHPGSPNHETLELGTQAIAAFLQRWAPPTQDSH